LLSCLTESGPSLTEVGPERCGGTSFSETNRGLGSWCLTELGPRQSPRTLEAALPIAAEHFAFSEEAHGGLRTVDEIARAIMGNPFWDFWWD
jgi:hypothetical protein